MVTKQQENQINTTSTVCNALTAYYDTDVTGGLPRLLALTTAADGTLGHLTAYL
jgi:hypothetical protein